MVWWGHCAHGEVADEVVERVQRRVWEGMGLICLHSSHFSKVFRLLMGTPCALAWREAGERERIWVINPGHPIVRGLGRTIEIPAAEMYSEPFSVPEPMETVLISWFEGGEVFRSGMTWQRGAGRIFCFRPGHEVYPIYHQVEVRQILRNAVRWAHTPAPAWRDVAAAPRRPVEQSFETIAAKWAEAAPGRRGGLPVMATQATDAPVRLLILGTGMMGGAHAQAFKAIEGCEIAAACDIDTEVLDAFRRRYGIERGFQQPRFGPRMG